jgi:hypothetical protein
VADDLAGLAAEAYLAGWALTGAAFTERAQAGCGAAVAVALEHRADPGILEAALDLGHLEGIWATVYARRNRLLATHLKRVMAAWNDCVKPLDARQLARRFRSDAYLTSETVSPDVQFWRDTGTAAALGWLRAVYRSGGHDALIAAIEDAIRSGMAEGEAGALAVAASRQGKTGFDIAAAFKAAYGRLAADHTIAATAAAVLTKIIDGAGTDLGRRLASMAGDGSSEDEIADTIADLAAGNDVRPVKSWLGDAIWAAIGAGITALYRLAGVALYDWDDAGDSRVCPVCEANAAGSPYEAGVLPAFPGHPGCRCNISTRERIPLALLAAFLS